jgi:Na+-transporting methylmalonyl-CoA/oxaloacetate decarboxylase gamma subunit
MLEHIISLSDSAAEAVATTEPARTVLENLGLGGSVALLGMTIVFLGLVSLIIITLVYPKIANALIAKSSVRKAKAAEKKQAKAKDKKKAEKAVLVQKVPVPAAAVATENDDVLIAVITAAIAASLGTSSNGVVIKSIERTGQNVPAWGARGRIEQVYNRL